MHKKIDKRHEIQPLNRKHKPELWCETNVGSRHVEIYFAQNFGSGGLMCEDGNQNVIILINKVYKDRPQVLADTLIHELTHVVELVYFEKTITQFGYAIPAACNPAVQSIGTGLAQAFSELEPAKGTRLALFKQLGFII